MFQGMSQAFKQFLIVFQSLTLPKKVGVLAALALVIAGFAGLIILSGQEDYKTLYSGLDESDAALVVGKLQELKVPYRLSANGSTIQVPVNSLLDTRLSLAAEGVPRGGGIGYEVFDQTKMGVTEFVQRINYQRAIQGELARTINQFKEVVSSRVHIVTPKDSLFVDQQKQPTAAIVLQLKDGRSLSATQVQAIVNLVSGSIEGLEGDQVSVVDTSGRVLYDKKDENQLAGLSQTQTEYKRKYESDQVVKIQARLDKVVGPGKSMAKVSADLDFDQEQRVEEEYNPDVTVIRSSQSTEEEQQGQAIRPTGSPDDQFKVTAQAGSQGGANSSYTRANETLNYEINKINRQVTKAAGEVKRLSIAVIIDGKYEKVPGQGNAPPTQKYIPRTKEELAGFVSLIKSAVGYDETRGDSLEVSSMPFVETEAVTTPPLSFMDRALDFLSRHGRTILVVVLGLLFFFLVVRPMIKWSGRELQEAMVDTKKLAAPEEGETSELEDLRHKGGPRERAALLAEKEPEMSIDVIRSWLHESVES